MIEADRTAFQYLMTPDMAPAAALRASSILAASEAALYRVSRSGSESASYSVAVSPSTSRARARSVVAVAGSSVMSSSAGVPSANSLLWRPRVRKVSRTPVVAARLARSSRSTKDTDDAAEAGTGVAETLAGRASLIPLREAMMRTRKA